MSRDPFLTRRLKAARSAALQRPELRGSSEQRKPATGMTSFPVKVLDPVSEKAIYDYLAVKKCWPADDVLRVRMVDVGRRR
jgi:hypothetical protein